MSQSPDMGASRRPIGLLLVAIPVLLGAWLVIWPIVSAILRTIWRVQPDGSMAFDLTSYAFFFSDGYSLNNLALTLWTTAVCAALLLIVCLPIALYLRFSEGRISGYVQALAILPMFVPSIILAYAFIRVLGPNGMVDLLLNFVGLPKIRTPYLTPWGPVIGLVWDNIPLTVTADEIPARSIPVVVCTVYNSSVLSAFVIVDDSCGLIPPTPQYWGSVSTNPYLPHNLLRHITHR